MINKPNAIDKLAGYISPSWAMNRKQARIVSKLLDDTYAAFSGSSYPQADPSRLRQDVAKSFSSTGVRHLRGATLRKLRDSSRKLDRENWLAKCLLNGAVTHTFGCGSRILPTTSSEDFNKRSEELWSEYWTEGKPEITDRFSGPELEGYAFRMMLRDGDCGIRLLNNGKLQYVPGDFIDTPSKVAKGKTVIDGIQLNSNGRPAAYWLMGFDKDGKRAHWGVPAKDFIHMARWAEYNELRGEPIFSNKISLFEQLEGYIDGTVVAARLASYFAVILTKSGGDAFSTLKKITDSQGNKVPELPIAPGTITHLGDSADSVHQLRPEQPTTQFDSFVRSLTRFAALDFGLPLELALLDFSQTNFSAARAAIIVSERISKQRHKNFTARFTSRIYQWKVSKWILDGKYDGIDIPKKTWKHRILQPRHAYLDPSKDIESQLMSIDGGLSTLSEALIERGGDIEQIINTKAKEKALIDQANIVIGRSTKTRDSKEEATRFVEGEDSENNE